MMPRKAAIPGLSRQPSEAAREVLLDPSDTLVLLLDHQTGLFQTVKDVPVRELRANTVVLAKIAELAKVPIIYTASEPMGTNGPIMEELAAAAPTRNSSRAKAKSVRGTTTTSSRPSKRPEEERSSWPAYGPASA